MAKKHRTQFTRKQKQLVETEVTRSHDHTLTAIQINALEEECNRRPSKGMVKIPKNSIRGLAVRTARPLKLALKPPPPQWKNDLEKLLLENEEIDLESFQTKHGVERGQIKAFIKNWNKKDRRRNVGTSDRNTRSMVHNNASVAQNGFDAMTEREDDNLDLETDNGGDIGNEELSDEELMD